MSQPAFLPVTFFAALPPDPEKAEAVRKASMVLDKMLNRAKSEGADLHCSQPATMKKPHHHIVLVVPRTLACSPHPIRVGTLSPVAAPDLNFRQVREALKGCPFDVGKYRLRVLDLLGVLVGPERKTGTFVKVPWSMLDSGEKREAYAAVWHWCIQTLRSAASGRAA